MEYCSQLNIEVCFAHKNLSYLSKPRHLLPYRNPLCIANYKQKGKRNGELLIPIPGPLERHRQQGDRNPESDTMGIILPQNVRIFSYNREASTDRRPST